MFTWMATTFQLSDGNGWKLDTIISDGMQTLCRNLEFLAFVCSER